MLAIFKQRWLIALFGIIALSLLIWFLGPLFAFAGYVPLGSVLSRQIAIGLVFLFWLFSSIWKFANARRKNSRLVAEMTAAPQSAMAPEQQASEEELLTLQERMREALDILKKTRLGGASGRQFLYQLPWYIIIGPPGSGKTTLLVNSDLKFPLAERFGNDAIGGVGGTRNCDWWFAENAVLLDTAGRYTTQDSQEQVDRSAWLGFLGLLKKHRRRRPLNGVIIAISISDILELNDDERQAHAGAVRNRIYELHENLDIRFPIYLLFTKCDLMAGFMEFFDDLDYDSRAQVWGMTFPLEEDPERNPVEQFDGEFDLLQQRLQRQVIDKLEQERSAEKRDYIYIFPQQFNAMKQLLSQFTRHIFQPTRYQHTAMLRGVYFTSATQQGSPIDRIMGALADNFGLGAQSLTSASGRGKSFFINRLLGNVIFAEAGLAGTDLRHERRRMWLQHGFIVAVLALTVLMSLLWWYSYTQNRNYINEISLQAAELQQMVVQLDPHQQDIVAALPVLDKAAQLSGYVAGHPENMPWSMGFGLNQSDKLQEAGKHVYATMLTQIFLPRLMTRLEQQIREIKTSDFLYEALKVYLMLGDSRHYSAEQIKAWIVLDWEMNLPLEIGNKQRRALTAHLDELLARQPVLPRPLDLHLIRQAQAALVRVPAAARIYGRLKRELAYTEIADFRISDAAGRDAPLVFRRESGSPLNEGIPGLYTYAGFHRYFLPESKNLAERLTNESWILGDHYRSSSASDLAELQNDVVKLYLEDYKRQWQALLDDIRIIPFANLAQASEVLNILSDDNSPLLLLLKAVARETDLSRTEEQPKSLLDKAGEKFDEAKSRLEFLMDKKPASQPSPIQNSVYAVTEQFKELNELVVGDNGPVPLESTLSLLNELYLFLSSLLQASGEELVLEHQKQIAQVLQKVKTAAKRQPSPVNDMLTSIAESSTSLVGGGICQHLNATWRAEVYAFCQAAINGRYPIAQSNQEITQQDFGLFFGPGGKMDSFLQIYLADSVDKSGKNWRWIKRSNSPVCLSRSTLAQIQRADTIKNTLFRLGGQTPSVSFRIRPVSMSADITQMTLDIDGQMLSYAHGPVRMTPIQWPGPNKSGQVSLQFLPPLMGGASRLSMEGPWALFRLFDKGNLINTGQAEQFIVKFNILGRELTLELHADSAINPFNLREMEQFRCPAHL